MAGVQNDDDFVADINVTPFVDVMLVLLIIFMVTTPMMTEGLDVELPKVQSAEILPMENNSIVLSIKADGTLFLDEFPLSLAGLDAALWRTALAPGQQLLLRADRQVQYGTVMDVMGRVRAAGITNLGMVAESLPSAALQESDRGSEASGAVSAPRGE